MKKGFLLFAVIAFLSFAALSWAKGGGGSCSVSVSRSVSFSAPRTTSFPSAPRSYTPPTTFKSTVTTTTVKPATATSAATTNTVTTRTIIRDYRPAPAAQVAPSVVHVDNSPPWWMFWAMSQNHSAQPVVVPVATGAQPIPMQPVAPAKKDEGHPILYTLLVVLLGAGGYLWWRNRRC